MVCDSRCRISTEDCQGVSDGVVFGFIDECTDFVDFLGGSLGCTGACQLDTSGCVWRLVVVMGLWILGRSVMVWCLV